MIAARALTGGKRNSDSDSGRQQGQEEADCRDTASGIHAQGLKVERGCVTFLHPRDHFEVQRMM
jgi:hypothetical protein